MKTEKIPSVKVVCDKCKVEFYFPHFPDIYSGPWVGQDETGKFYGTFDAYQSIGFNDIRGRVERLLAEKGYRKYEKIDRAFWNTVLNGFSKLEDGTSIRFMGSSVCLSCGHEGINLYRFEDQAGPNLDIPVVEFEEYLRLSEAEREDSILNSWVEWYPRNKEFVEKSVAEAKWYLLRNAVRDMGLWVLLVSFAAFFFCVWIVFTSRALLPLSVAMLLSLVLIFAFWEKFSNWVAGFETLREWYWFRKKG